MPIRVGVVGTAYWAREVHVPGLLQAGGMDLIGVWGRNATIAGEVAERYAIPSFPTFEAMLSAVDALTIAVPPEVQAELGMRAAAAGKHVIFEKPLATSAAAAQAIADEMARQRRTGLVFFTRRFDPATAAAIDAARGRAWQRANVVVHSSALTGDTPYIDSAWRKQRGALWDIGPHVLSMLIPLLGPVDHVSAEVHPDGGCMLRTVHRDGASAQASLTLRAQPGTEQTRYHFVSPTDELAFPEGESDRAATFRRAAEVLAAMIAAGEIAHDCDVRFGATVVRVLEAAEESANRGAPVAIGADQAATMSRGTAADAFR